MYSCDSIFLCSSEITEKKNLIVNECVTEQTSNWYAQFYLNSGQTADLCFAVTTE